MKARSQRIIYNDELSPGLFRMGIAWKATRIRPGQFVMLRIAEALDPFLRRPFGIYKVLGRSGARMLSGEGIEIIYRVVGVGTTVLSARKPDEYVGVFGPLGNGFPLLRGADAARAVMVAGGVGIAPFYLLAEGSKAGGRAGDGPGLLLYGAPTAADTAITKDFRKLGCRVKVATEDGSAGTKGLVTDLLAGALKPDSLVYACGPPPMLKAVAAMAAGAGAKCLVSLERAMACGIGVCLGCALKTGGHEKAVGYEMVCTDGPVFDASIIDWEML